MRVPFGAGRTLFTIGLTAGMSAYALTRHALGDPTAIRRLTPKWARAASRGIGMEIETFGAELVPVERPCILMANHQSQSDIIAVLTALPITPGFLAKKELRDVPIFGAAMEAGGHVFIDRAHRKEALAAIDQAAAQVRQGSPIMIFPEGTRSDAGTVKAFKKGGFHLAKKAGVPLVPVGLRGTASILPKHGRRPQPGRVEVHVGVPIEPDEIAALPLLELVEKTRAEVARLADMKLV